MTGMRSFLLLRPARGRVPDVVGYYLKHGVLEAALPYGLIKGQILHPRHDPEDLLITSVWPDRAGYEAWRRAPERAGLLDGLTPLLDGPEAVRAWTGRADASPHDGYHPGRQLVVAHQIDAS